MRLFYFMHNHYQPRPPIQHQKITYYDLTFLLDGEMHWKINGKEYHLKKGDVFLVQKNSFRERTPFDNCNYYSFNFFADETIDLPPVIKEGITSEIRVLLSACDEIHTRVLESNEALKYTLQSLLSILSCNLKSKSEPIIVQTMKRYIAQHIYEPLNLEAITGSTFFSTVHCSNMFKKSTGKSIIDYVLDEKVDHAKQYILEGMPLRQVSEAMGFTDYNYFSRMFKKRTGATPLKYRQSMLSKK